MGATADPADMKPLPRDVAGCIAPFWSGGRGPSHSSIGTAFDIAGYDEPSSDGNKEDRVRRALRQAPPEIARRLAEELVDLLRSAGTLTEDSDPYVVRLRTSLERHGGRLTDEGILAWDAGSPVTTPSGSPVEGLPQVASDPALPQEPAKTLDPRADALRALTAQGRALLRASGTPEQMLSMFCDFDERGRRALRSLWPDRGPHDRFDTADGRSLRLRQLPRGDWARVALADTAEKLEILEQLSSPVQAFDPSADFGPAMKAQPDELGAPVRIFVVHGHHEALKYQTVRLLEKALPNAEVIILHEVPNEGDTIIEKLERFSDVAFAVVLVTGDDAVTLLNGAEEKRARQNVVLELGWFLGRLGRKRVCALLEGGVQTPSDYAGVAYTALDAAGAWRSELLRELNAAGLTPDWEAALR